MEFIEQTADQTEDQAQKPKRQRRNDYEQRDWLLKELARVNARIQRREAREEAKAKKAEK